MKLHNIDLNQKWKVGKKTGSKHPPRYIGHSVITESVILELQCTNNILDKFENGSGSGVSLSIATVANGSCFLKVAPLFFKVAN